MTGTNQAAQLIIGHQIGGRFNTTAFGRNPREGINNSPSGSCGDVRIVGKAGQLKEALHVLNRQSIRVSTTFVDLLRDCINRKDLAKGKQVHAHIIQNGFPPNPFLLKTLVNMYAKCGSMVDAREVFDKMPERDLFTWTTMMTGYAKTGHAEEALKIYEQMQKEGVVPDRVTFTSVLNACTSLEALEKGKAVHADIIKAGIAPDIILDNTLVDMYAKCGSIMDARQIFDNMARRDVVSWSVMIAGYAQHGVGREAVKIYEQMAREGVMPDRITFICVLNACTTLGALEKGKEVHADIIKSGLASYINLENTLVDMYAKCGSMKDAQQVFDNMAKRDVVSWSAMIAGYAQHECVREAFKMYEQMSRDGVTPNRVTFICILNACATLRALGKGKEVHADIILSGIKSYINLENALVNMYAKCGSMNDARQVFDQMAERNVISWSAMLTGYAQHRCDREAFKIYKQMQRERVAPDRVMFTCVVNACASLGSLKMGKQVHTDIRKSGIVPDIIMENSLVDMYTKCGSVKDARQVFDNMAERDVVSWNAMMAGYAQHGCGREALEVYEQMQREGITPDMFTFTSILNACASLGALEKSKEVHADITKSGIVSCINLDNTLVDMYAKCGSMKDARQVFDNMAERDVVSWNAMITGYAQNGCGREACSVYEQMQLEGVIPDSVTFTCVLNACASLGALEKGKQVHADIIKSGIMADIILENSLVDMYAKCGSVMNACQVFDTMGKRDVVSWNAMIAGYAHHGYGREALQLFERMQQEGFKPDDVTFISLLSTCSHVGLVDEGHHYFVSMKQDHGLSPMVEHFNCMVDLLGRAGRLKEAEDFINKVTIQPHTGMWNTLLGACKIHGDVEVTERVAKHILDGHPQDAGNHVLSNIYAAAACKMKLR